MTDDPAIRMLLVSRRPEQRKVWQQAAECSPILIEAMAVDSGVAAQSELESGGIDIVVLDCEFPEPDRSMAVQAARRARTRPIIVITVGVDTDATGIYGDGVVTQPSGIAEAEYLIDRILRARLPSQVLIVDDSKTMRGIVRKILMATQFPLEVSEAAEGEAALARLRQGNFDLIFLDYNMPGLNGLETLAQIRRDHPRLEVVMISSAEEDIMASRFRSAGAIAFLKKPFYPADINQVLHAFCGLRPVPGH